MDTIIKRLAARYLKAMEFDTPEAMKKYLKEHPGADKSKHKVVETQHDEKKMRAVENSADPGEDAYDLVRKGLAPAEWAMKVIEKDGDPEAAYSLWAHGNYAPREWAEKVVEKATKGEPAETAYSMLVPGGSSIAWVKKVVENTELGNPAFIAEKLHRGGYVRSDWVVKIKDKMWIKKHGDPRK